MIRVKNINKSFKISKRNSKFSDALKSFLKRDYEIIRALKNISFEIDEGEIVGYIGPNGAGKSTTIKIISGILVPDDGECKIMNRIPWKDRINHVSNIGVVFGQRSQLWWDIAVMDSFLLLKDIYKVPESEFRENLKNLTDILDISKITGVPVRQLSLGQRMKCEIIASLLHSPKLLFLDEPTIGLDAVSKIAIRNFIKDLNKREKVTVILTTHDMNDIEELANRIILIGRGEILFDNSLKILREKFGKNKIINVDYNKSKEDSSLDNFSVISKDSNNLNLMIDSSKISVSEALSKITKKYDISDITVENPSIEDVIVKLYKEHSI
jgi:ABC-2 type transport system ATP-binding protein